MDDSEIIAAITAGDPAGLAGAYDKYAPGLYGYCRWILGEPSDAADALLKTFAAAGAELAGREDASETRARLYAVARAECSRRPHPAGTAFDEMVEQTHPSADAEDPDELRRLTRAILAELKPQEHEILELSIRHGLYEVEVAAVLGLSWDQAYELASQACDYLTKTLDGLLIVPTGRRFCPELGSLLADWDGRLTVPTGKVAAEHIDHCERCALLRHGPLRPEVLSSLLPLAPLPPELRQPILEHPAAGTTPASRGGMTWRTRLAGLAGFQRLGQLPAWSRIRANPGAATAAVAVAVWVVAAMSATLITVTGTHTVLAAQTHPATPAATTPVAIITASPPAKPIPRPSPRPTIRPVQTYVAPVITSPSPTESAEPTPSRSAEPSASASSSSSVSPSPTYSGTPSPSPSPTHSHTPSPRPTPPASSSPSPSS